MCKPSIINTLRRIKNMTKAQKCSDSQRGRIVVNKHGEEKRVYQTELATYLKGGWERGYSEQHCKKLQECAASRPSRSKGRPVSAERKAKISRTLKERNKSDPNCGWRKYWQTPHEAWNKGLKKESDARVMNMSKGKLGHNVSVETRTKISQKTKGRKVPAEKLRIQLSKAYITKKLHNSFNTSGPEEHFYKKLLELNKHFTIYRQYKDERYPFYCDFYIKELDTFIELNMHWTHGQHPFDAEDPRDQATLLEWNKKAQTSSFYKAAIDVWTERDPKKRRTAKERKLHYIELFTPKDVDIFLDNI